jgi:hypothetical protein
MVQRDRRRPPAGMHARLLGRTPWDLPHQHVVQPGRGTFGRRDTPDDRFDPKVHVIGRNGRCLLCSVRVSCSTWCTAWTTTIDRGGRTNASADRHTMHKQRTTFPPQYKHTSSIAYTVRPNKKAIAKWNMSAVQSCPFVAPKWTGRSWFILALSASSSAYCLSCWWWLSGWAVAHVRATTCKKDPLHGKEENKEKESMRPFFCLFSRGQIQTTWMIEGCVVIRAATV